MNILDVHTQLHRLKIDFTVLFIYENQFNLISILIENETTSLESYRYYCFHTNEKITLQKFDYKYKFLFFHITI